MSPKSKRRIAVTGLTLIGVLVLTFVVALPALAASCFTDTGGHWAETYVCWLFNNGIASGYPDGSFRPDNSITRGEMAVMLQQVAGAGSAGPVANADLLDGHDTTDFVLAPNPSTLNYTFLPGPAFTSDQDFAIQRLTAINGCVIGMPLNGFLSAPVYLPQGSQVVSITLYTYDDSSTTTTITAWFVFMGGQGWVTSTVQASSQPNTVGYQQNTSTGNNPVTVDNQNNGFYVRWWKVGGSDSVNLGLCGVRVNYYLP